MLSFKVDVLFLVWPVKNKITEKKDNCKTLGIPAGKGVLILVLDVIFFSGKLKKLLGKCRGHVQPFLLILSIIS